MSTLVDLIIRHEGIRRFPYTDTQGKLTIGVGHNLSDNGLTRDAIEFILTEDIAAIMGEIRKTFPWFDRQVAARQDAIVDMAFNLGMPRLKTFVNMLGCMECADYKGAAREMRNSGWAAQVGTRAIELASMVEKGDYL